jgi:G3E family GTPase
VTPQRLPVSIITGFLGSGKTTLLNRLLADPAMADAVVIINEFGEIGIDHLLVSAPAENMVLLSNGCLCCTVRGDLVETLGDLVARRTRGEIPPYSRVLVETTGLADPVPIIQTVVTDEALAAVYRLQNVATLVDGVHGERQLDTHPESVKQAAVADVLLVSKADLAGAQHIDTLSRRLRAINPGAEIHVATRGDIDTALFFTGDVHDAAASAAQVERWLNEAAYARVDTPAPTAAGRRRGPRHDDRIHAFCLHYDKPITGAGLNLWLQMLAGLRGANLLRVKAILNVEGDPVVVQAVQTVVHEPVTLDAWPGADRRSRFVFITRGMERADIERTFEALDFAPRLGERPVVDAQAYAQFIQAMQGFR